MSIDNFKRSLYALKATGKFEKSKLKATYDGDYNPPKEKHVQSKVQLAILWTLQGQNPDTSPEVAFPSLVQRLMGSHWPTALKTEMILHRGIEQVGPAFAAKLADLNLSLQNFEDPSERGSAHNGLIQLYFQFIRIKAQSFSRRHSVMTTPAEERGRFFQRLDSSALLRETRALLEQLEKLVQLGPLCHKAIRNYQLKVTQHCAALILKDATPLYQTLELGMGRLLELTGSLDRSGLEQTANMLKSEHWCTGMLAKFFEVCRMLPYAEIAPPLFVRREQEVLRKVQMRQDGAEEEAEQRQIREEFESKPRKEDLPTVPAVQTSPAPSVLQPTPMPTSPVLQAASPPQPSKADLIMSAYYAPPMDPYAAMRTQQQLYANQMMANQMMAMQYQQYAMPPAALRTYNPFETGAPPRADSQRGNPFL